MKIYTRGGDQGQTTAGDGTRRFKHDIRVQAYGSVDEAGAFVGLAIAHMDDPVYADMVSLLSRVQLKLFDAGADLSRGVREGSDYTPRTSLADVVELEKNIDEYRDQAPAVKKFIMRGGSRPAAFLHTACVVVRRAERQVGQLQSVEEIHRPAFIYLNRLSDLLFVLARAANARAGRDDVLYERGGDVFH